MKVRLDNGTVVDLGVTEITPTISLTDYSRRVTDDFGVTTIVPRAFSRRLSLRMLLPTTSVDVTQRQLVDLRATPADWIADDLLTWLQVRGFYREFEFDVATPTLSYCTLSFEGLAETETVADSGGDPAVQSLTSSLRLLQPIDVTDAVLASSSVAENDAASWGAGTTYGLGARVSRAHRVFESLVPGNVGNDPSATPAAWLDTGPTNRWAMFDQALGTATTSGGSITVAVNAGSSRAVALLDVVASSVRVRATGYDRTLAPTGGSALFLDLPANAGTITVTVTATNQVAIGTLLVGAIVGLGSTEASPTAGITDYSRKEIDDFGAVTVVPRAFAKRMSARSMIRSDAVDQVANRIASVRARACLWIADNALDSVTIYGFFKDFSIEVGPAVSKLSLSVEGLSKAQPLPKPPPEGPNIVAQGSVDGVNWHEGLQTGDVYMRLSTDYGVTFGTPVKIAGEDATPGEDGSYQQQIFKRSPTRPATPTGGGIPAGWSDGVPDGTDLIWLSVQYQRNGIALGPWSLPANIKGDPGGSAFALVNVGNCVFPSPSSIAKVAGSGTDWNGKAHTAEFSTGSATVSGKMQVGTFIGLTTDPAVDTHFGSIDYGLHVSTTDNGKVYIFRNGVAISNTPDGIRAAPGARGLVISDGKTVRYSIEGLGEVGSHPVNAVGETIYGVFELSRDVAGEQISGITFATGGRNGTDGLPGEDGADGKTYYPYFAYADSPDGSVNFTTLEPGARTYEGRKFGLTPTEPGNPAEYTWRPYYGPPFGMDVRGNCSVAGRTVTKAGGGGAWDSDAYSTSGYTGGAIATARSRDGTSILMFGLNSDPRADSSYTSLDYAWYLRGDGYASFYESGNPVNNDAPGAGPGYGTGKFDVVYTGRFIRYLYNDVVKREVDVGAGRTFYFDSSFFTPGGSLTDIDFASVGAEGEDGTPGTDGFILDTEHTEFLVPVFASGAAKPSWVGAQGTIKLTKGGARITAGVTYNLRSADKLAGLSLSGDVFSFAGITADTGTFVIQASYAGQLYERTITIKKVYDGNNAFRGSATFNQTAGGGVVSLAATATAVPSSSGMRLSANANYAPLGGVVGSYRARLHLYWENQTDNGGVQYLGYADGTAASTVNQGTANDPDYVSTPGSVSAAFNFAGFPADKRIAFYVNIERIAGNLSVQVTGGAQLDTI